MVGRNKAQVHICPVQESKNQLDHVEVGDVKTKVKVQMAKQVKTTKGCSSRKWR